MKLLSKFSVVSAGVLLGLAPSICAAQAAPISSAPLPSAPSAVLAEQDLQFGKVAGSGAKYTPGATVAGPEKVGIEQATSTPLPLSLDDAIAYGFERNVRLKYDRANQREVKGETGTVFSALIPNLQVSGSTETQQINLAAMGFKASSLAAFGFAPGTIKTIVKVDVTQAQISASQQLFNLPDYELYRGAKSEVAVVDLNMLNSRGDLVQAVGTAYLQVIADKANVANAVAEEESAKKTFDNATAEQQAGVGTHLDALRAQVDYQQHQQQTVAETTALAKDVIQLNRIMGLPAEQALELTDAAPFAALAEMDLETAKATAYAHRKDLLALQATILVEDRELKAVKYQRYPTLAFNGFYGVIGETEGLYHGVFRAAGELKVPIFREAAQRGEQDQIAAQLMALHLREADMRVAIEAQIRSAMLDVNSAQELVKVAESNVELSQQELADERDRFAAGVDDNLPVIDAQAAVTGAQAQLVNALYQYNVAKLQLARNTGVVETRYRHYLGQ